jgi:putative tricarboxylic transport membrane protein
MAERDAVSMTRRTDILSGLVLAALSLFLLVWLIPANTSPPQSENNLSPAFLPTVAAIVMLVLATLLALVSWTTERADGDRPHEEFGEEARGIGLAEATDIAVWSAFSFAMMVGFLTIGFIPTAVPALALMMIYTGARGPVTIAAVAIAVPVAIQQVAWHAFTVQLP